MPNGVVRLKLIMPDLIPAFTKTCATGGRRVIWLRGSIACYCRRLSIGVQSGGFGAAKDLSWCANYDYTYQAYRQSGFA